MKMVKCLPELSIFFTVFLKKRNFISKIRISKVTDYAALNGKVNTMEHEHICGMLMCHKNVPLR